MKPFRKPLGSGSVQGKIHRAFLIPLTSPGIPQTSPTACQPVLSALPSDHELEDHYGLNGF